MMIAVDSSTMFGFFSKHVQNTHYKAISIHSFFVEDRVDRDTNEGPNA